MAITTPRGGQIKDGSIQRVDLDVSTAGQAVIAKAIQGTGVLLSSTGTDAGTGDVTISRNPAVDFAFTVAQSITVDDSVTGGVSDLLALYHTSSGTPTTNFGVALFIKAESDSQLNRTLGRLKFAWSTAVDSSRTSYLTVDLVNAATDQAVARFSGAGGLSVGAGTTVDSANGVINAATGFRIANAATSGEYLRGNGTNFVSAVIAGGDIPANFAYAFTAAHSIIINDSETGGASGPFLTLGHNSSGTPAANLGTRLGFQIETSTTTNVDAGSISVQWSDVTHASRVAYMDFLLGNAGSPASKMRLHGSGGLSVNATADPGAGVINANTGFRVGNAAASRKILVGDGTNFVVSTETWAAPGTAGYALISDGTNWVSKAADLFNASTSQGAGFASDTYITNSLVTISAGDVAVGTTYYLKVQAVKTAAGTATPIFSFRFGTAGSTADTARVTFTFTAGTAAIDTGIFEFWLTFSAVGASAVVTGTARMTHNLTSTGLSNTGTIPLINSSAIVSGAFSSTTVTKIGCSLNAGTSASWTLSNIHAELLKPS